MNIAPVDPINTPTPYPIAPHPRLRSAMSIPDNIFTDKAINNTANTPPNIYHDWNATPEIIAIMNISAMKMFELSSLILDCDIALLIYFLEGMKTP